MEVESAKRLADDSSIDHKAMVRRAIQRVAGELSYNRTRIREILDSGSFPSELSQPIFVLYHSVLDHAAAVAAEQPHETTLRYPPSAALRRLDLPVTIVVGERSQPYFHRIARRLQRLIPTARLHETADASHAAHLDSPAEVAALLG
jgi:pimeloyl-ACP methyl ester carboxylesterase